MPPVFPNSDPNAELDEYFKLLRVSPHSESDQLNSQVEGFRTAPIVSWDVLRVASGKSPETDTESLSLFPQYGLLGENISAPTQVSDRTSFNPVFFNINAPWSAFVCGSQGSGKSHTLSCLLEGSVLPNPSIGALQAPLAALVFFFDPHSESVSEVAHLASTGVSVRVLVSPSNFGTMEKRYKSLPCAENIQIKRFYIAPEDLTIEKMKRLMAVADNSDVLYMEIVTRILREMRLESDGEDTFDYFDFRRRIGREHWCPGQRLPLELRLRLLESLLDTSGRKSLPVSYRPKPGYNWFVGEKEDVTSAHAFRCLPGTVTIVDLTDPFIDAAAACSLFEMCLSLFLSRTATKGKIVALDEAHHYLSQSSNANSFTQAIIRAVREQRHKGLRIVVATQEPTVTPALVDLCSITITHRFTSPAWMEVLKKHIGGLALLPGTLTSNSTTVPGPSQCSSECEDDSFIEDERLGSTPELGLQSLSSTDFESAITAAVNPRFSTLSFSNVSEVFKTIMNLNVGEALVFCPSGIVNPSGEKLGPRFLKLKVRPRISTDGGQSILACPAGAPSRRGGVFNPA